MFRAPERFTERLERMFAGRLRIRWSIQRDEWQIEYKVGRGRAHEFYISPTDDNAIRARDGYAYLLSLRNGDRMPCPKCNFTIPVPVLKFAETTCDYCKVMGREYRHTAAFFPLDGDSIFEHLRKIDPYLGHRDRLIKMADAQNERVLAAKERDFANHMDSIGLHNYAKMREIQSVGWRAAQEKGV